MAPFFLSFLCVVCVCGVLLLLERHTAGSVGTLRVGLRNGGGGGGGEGLGDFSGAEPECHTPSPGRAVLGLNLGRLSFGIQCVTFLRKPSM